MPSKKRKTSVKNEAEKNLARMYKKSGSEEKDSSLTKRTKKTIRKARAKTQDAKGGMGGYLKRYGVN